MAVTQFRHIVRLFLFISILALFVGCKHHHGNGSDDNTAGGENLTLSMITAQPADQTIALNVPAIVSVTANGDDLSYQWESSDDNGVTWKQISGATSASYSFTPTEKMTTLFRCTVTNKAGSVISDPAKLTIVSVVFVNDDATGANNGANWSDAFKSLQDALKNAQADSEVWVAAGTYTPGDSRDATFRLVKDVAVYGGFTGNETSREARNWKGNITILSGEIGDRNKLWDNCYHVVTGADDASIDGFTITRGCAFSPRSDDVVSGAGMLNVESSPNISNCTFSGNISYGSGGGMDNCSNSCPTIVNCTFSGNLAVNFGGGMYNESSSPIVVNCAFTGNSAAAYGGGMSSFWSDSTVTNCTFAGNATDGGGGVGDYECVPKFSNCILWDNTAPDAEYEQIIDVNSKAAFTYCCIQDGKDIFPGEGNIYQDPKFTRSPDPGIDGTWDGKKRRLWRPGPSGGQPLHRQGSEHNHKLGHH